MKLRQNVRHFAAKQALTTPVLGDYVRERLVDLHTGVFLKRTGETNREERRAHLDALFECTIDAYVTALEAGYPEAEAREITHIQANFDFYNQGWTEMMEFPTEEVDAHYDRYREFFEEHEITIDDPLGEFRTVTVPTAPATPDKLDDPEHPHAEGGFADDAYVETTDGELVVGGQGEPDDVDVSDAPGVSEDEP